MKKTIKKISVLSIAMLSLTLATQAQWTENATAVYLNSTIKNVGIGTTTPAFALDLIRSGSANLSLKSTTGTSNLLLDRANSAATSSVSYRTNGVGTWQTGTVGNDNFNIRNIGLGNTAFTILSTNNYVGLGVAAPSNRLSVNGDANFTGNVGIGTTNPSSKLEVTGSVKITDGTQGAGRVLTSDSAGLASWKPLPAGPTGPQGIQGLTGATGPQGPAGLLPSGLASGNTAYWNGSAWVTNSSNIFNNGGNVGIGTLAPNFKFQVAGNTSVPQIGVENVIDSTAAISFITPYARWTVGQNRPAGSNTLTDAFYIKNQNLALPSMVISSVGNIGFGTNTPTEKLHVTGNTLVTGNSTINGRIGLPIVNTISKLNIEDTHPSDAFIRLVNTTKGPNISWAGIGTNGDWSIRSCSNSGVVGMQDQAGGRIGLGTTNPLVGSKVEIKGETGANTVVFTPSTGNQSWIHYGVNGDWYIRSANATAGKVIIQDLGSAPLCVGTTQAATGYKLSVGGKVMCEEIKVQLKANWPDYVFTKEYKGLTIKQIDEFVKENNHLPGMPSAAEVNKNGGIELGEMQRLLLEKVEELMLQNIQQQKEIESLKKLIVKK